MVDRNAGSAAGAPFKNHLVYRFARYAYHRQWHSIGCLLSQWRYRDNAFDGAFDWKWKGKSYNRVALVNLLVSQFENAAYLEIGCASDSLFHSVCATRKVGVDPVRGGTVRQTSDEFFAANRSSFDVVFIDGLHTYDQVRRDVSNAIQCLDSGGWVALHDMLPRNWVEQHVPNLSPNAWLGQVWKVAFESAEAEGIDFRILLIDHGVGVFRVTTDDPVVPDLSAHLHDKGFAFFFENISKLPIFEWADCQDWLRP